MRDAIATFLPGMPPASIAGLPALDLSLVPARGRDSATKEFVMVPLRWTSRPFTRANERNPETQEPS